jgi:hypothetical protein
MFDSVQRTRAHWRGGLGRTLVEVVDVDLRPGQGANLCGYGSALGRRHTGTTFVVESDGTHYRQINICTYDVFARCLPTIVASYRGPFKKVALTLASDEGLVVS